MVEITHDYIDLIISVVIAGPTLCRSVLDLLKVNPLNASVAFIQKPVN